jgi:hypothetical protein
MSPHDDLEPLSDSITEVFERLGLPNPTVLADLGSMWDELADEPWRGRSHPLVVRGKTLVVEAAAPSMVAFLKYGVSDLVDRLAERFGEGVISAVEVVPPGRF